MYNSVCLHCGGLNLTCRDVEIRQINVFTMAVKSQEKIRELECLDCGWMTAAEENEPLLALTH
jgi:hypothetical protein